jgi:hypothetical protein
LIKATVNKTLKRVQGDAKVTEGGGSTIRTLFEKAREAQKKPAPFLERVNLT